MKKKLLLLFVWANLGFSAFAVNTKPFTIPEIKEWKGGEGTMIFSGRIVCKGVTESRVARQLAADYRRLFGTEPAVVQGKAQKGDIVLSLKGGGALGEEGYTMAVKNQAVVTARTGKGLYWATRTASSRKTVRCPKVSPTMCPIILSVASCSTAGESSFRWTCCATMCA